jgi:hypothetical protein
MRKNVLDLERDALPQAFHLFSVRCGLMVAGGHSPTGRSRSQAATAVGEMSR